MASKPTTCKKTKKTFYHTKIHNIAPLPPVPSTPLIPHISTPYLNNAIPIVSIPHPHQNYHHNYNANSSLVLQNNNNHFNNSEKVGEKRPLEKTYPTIPISPQKKSKTQEQKQQDIIVLDDDNDNDKKIHINVDYKKEEINNETKKSTNLDNNNKISRITNQSTRKSPVVLNIN